MPRAAASEFRDIRVAKLPHPAAALRPRIQPSHRPPQSARRLEQPKSREHGKSRRLQENPGAHRSEHRGALQHRDPQPAIASSAATAGPPIPRPTTAARRGDIGR